MRQTAAAGHRAVDQGVEGGGDIAVAVGAAREAAPQDGAVLVVGSHLEAGGCNAREAQADRNSVVSGRTHSGVAAGGKAWGAGGGRMKLVAGAAGLAASYLRFARTWWLRGRAAS